MPLLSHPSLYAATHLSTLPPIPLLSHPSLYAATHPLLISALYSTSELDFKKCVNPEQEYVDLRGIRIQIHLSSKSAAANKKVKNKTILFPCVMLDGTG
jgi:hypothetical protein